VCTAFLALSLLEEGYEVSANSEASGTYSRCIAGEANNHPGYPELSPYFD
ncbi:hypothetical protein MPER_00010, partial [Moniliophthora perniciosa FA553]